MNGQLANIVITGAGLITALGRTRDQVWQAVRAGRCGMGAMSAMEQLLPDGREGGQAVDLSADFLPDLPREARYLRCAIADALKEAGIDSHKGYAPERCAFMVGTTLHGMRAAGRFYRSNDFSDLRTFLAGHTLDLAGSGLPIEGLAATTCSACSSSLGSIALGVTLLQCGQFDLVIAGGYDTISEYVYAGFNSLRLVAEGALRPFSRNRQGMKLGEGYGIVVLERAFEAAQRGAKPLAMVAGWGESADAHHLTQPHPQGAGASRAMNQAIQRAALTPRDIGFIAAHATGTPDNDAAEYAAMSAVFAERLVDVPVVGFKSHVGHTLGGAGAVELILSMTALREQTVPPCATVQKDEIAFDGLQVATGEPRRATIRATLNTSLGFGGANTSVVLTSPPPHPARFASPRLRDVLVTGVGVVMPGVLGNDAFRERLADTSAPPAWEKSWGPIPDSELEGFLNARRVRRMSDYVKMQLAAANIACKDAGIDNISAFAENCSAILGTMHGSSSYCHSYYSQVVREGIAAANPMLFAEGVPNAGAAQLSLMLGLKGACQTIIGTRTSGLDALGLASARIGAGAWDRAIVGGGEEYSEIIHNAYRSCGLALNESSGAVRVGGGFVYGGGAVALILESKESLEQRRGRALAKVARSASRKAQQATIPAAMSSVLAQLGPAQAIISSACNTWIDRAEAMALRRDAADVPVWSPHGYAPELFSAGPFLGIAALCLGRKLPRAIAPAGATDGGLRQSTGEESPITVNVVATDFTGCVAGARIEML